MSGARGCTDTNRYGWHAWQRGKRSGSIRQIRQKFAGLPASLSPAARLRPHTAYGSTRQYPAGRGDARLLRTQADQITMLCIDGVGAVRCALRTSSNFPVGAVVEHHQTLFVPAQAFTNWLTTSRRHADAGDRLSFSTNFQVKEAAAHQIEAGAIFDGLRGLRSRAPASCSTGRGRVQSPVVRRCTSFANNGNIGVFPRLASSSAQHRFAGFDFNAAAGAVLFRRQRTVPAEQSHSLGVNYAWAYQPIT